MPGFAEIQEALASQPLFEDKTWRFSPYPWPLDADQIEELRAIGEACLEFYRALEFLYFRSFEGKNLLRNRPLKAPWVADYLDRGKPPGLIEHARSKRLRSTLPVAIRPDLLMTDDGFALTEIDSVPGGIGLTAYLNDLYENSKANARPPDGNGNTIVGGKGRMIQAFYDSLRNLVPHIETPFIAILVSDEAATYRPEMDWISFELRKRGKRVHCFHPEEVMPLGDTLCVPIDGNPVQVDVVYRFWELFDLGNVRVAEFILEAWDESTLIVSPPMRPFQEEKMSLALFHHHLLDEFWKEKLSRQAYRLLKRIVPPTWIMDKVDIPPTAVLDAPLVGGKPIWKWEQLGEATQKERNFIIKISGYHETAWGARSVILGSDVSSKVWKEGIQAALDSSERNLHILQEYRKPKRLQHTVYIPPEFQKPGQDQLNGDSVYSMSGRVRLCPYYFVNHDRAELTGVLSTFCPEDKKIIHGMKDAALLPCAAV